MADKLEYRVEGQKWYEKPTSQANKRTYTELTDQFGRKWGTLLDMTAKPAPGPVGPIAPLGWNDPLKTPPKYLKHGKDGMLSLYIEVDKWIADIENANEAWNQLVIDTAIEMSPADGGASLIGQGGADMAPALLRRVGRAPEAIEPVRALKAGNKFVLGLTDKMPAWAEPFFRKEVKKAEAESYEFPDAEDEDKYGDLEEEVDPEAIGGKRVNPKKAKKVA